MTTKIQRGIRRRPDLETVFSINPDGSRNMLQPADVRGRWRNRRNWIFLALIAFYVVLPWIRIGGAPALRFDVPARTAYVLGHTFTREDFYLVFFLLTGFGFALFAVTSLLGRVWCGYACPQTVFLEGVFRRIERWIEGPREVRIRRNLGPWTGDKTGRKLAKWAIYLVLVFTIAHAFLAYFLPVHELLSAVRGDDDRGVGAGVVVEGGAWGRRTPRGVAGAGEREGSEGDESRGHAERVEPRRK